MIVPTRSHTDQRIVQLAAAVEAGDDTALETFWKTVAADGAPLMEPMPDDESKTLVTFLWRDPGDTRNVLVLFYSAPTQNGFDEILMERLPGTDLWFKTYVLPSDLRTTYLLSVNDSLEPYGTYAEVLARIPGYRPDPLNPREVTILDDLVVSVLELPQAPKQPWNIARRGVPKGRNHMHLLDSEILGTQHHLTVHTPPGYDPESAEEYPLFVLFDGWAYFNFAATPTVLDNLLYAKRIPPFVLVMHSNTDQAVRARELTCHEPFADFLARELIPFLRENYRVTDDPAQTYVGGSCFGGLAAAYVAYKLPGIFGNVISQSGSFWWPERETPETEMEWLTRQFAQSPKLPIRFSMEVGSLEAAIVEFDQLATNRKLRDVLLEKGYEVDYSEYSGGHDMITWRGTLVNRLLALAARKG
ncbi:enterochelin esterase [Micromonospora mirobrigensis]|uniref:Enterochelin esterase n=1 Tax=Micromonospora mirobrigensis TaxID=262898 RepID=A0A1C4V300_9ACTN|nr:enterochelin esterase [Micromonospora mirobrigensis]SCE78246.1 enterochelin esterase [Micromonospora mirobrigensis]